MTHTMRRALSCIPVSGWEKVSTLIGWRPLRLLLILFLPVGIALSSQAADISPERERFELKRDLALALEKTARRAEAIALYRELLRNRHASAKERYQLSKRLAFALDAAGDHRRAAVEFEALLASPDLLAADMRQLRSALAHNLRKSGQYRRAVWQWQQVLDQLPDGHPDIPRIQLHLADLFEKLDQDAAAAAVYTNLLNSAVDDEALRYRFAWLHNRHQRHAEAWALIKTWPRPHPDPQRLILQTQTAFWAGQDSAALALYPLLLRHKPKATELRVQYAELLRRNGRMAEAAEELTFLVSRQPADKDHRILLVETLLDAGKPAAANPHIDRLLQTDADLAPVRILAARVAADQNQPHRAIRQLTALNKLQPLTPEQQLWLGDLLRATGQRREARQAYADAIRRAPQQIPPRAWVALGDLDFDANDNARALANYQQALAYLPKAGEEQAAVQLKIARSAARLADHERAAAAYAAYLSTHPEDGEIHLEAARALAAQGQNVTAAGHYRRAVALRGSIGLEMELAHAFMAVEAYDEAEIYARKIVDKQGGTSEDNQNAARRLLVEILLYSGRDDAATERLNAYRRDFPQDPAALLLQAEIDLTRDRKLSAYTGFKAAAAAGAADQQRLGRGLSKSALNRGDLWRAGSAIASLGDEPPASENNKSLMTQYRKATAPRLELLTAWNSDSNDLIVRQAGVQGAAAVGAYRLPLHLRYTLGEVAQDDTDFRRQALRLGLAPHFLQPNLSAEGYLGIEAVGDADHHSGSVLPIGELVVRRYWPDDSSLGFAVTRDTVWTVHDSPELHRYHRITHLDEVEPAFARTDLRLLMDKRYGDGGRLWQSSLGADVYTDDNMRLWGYTHLQVPMVETEERWSALKPNFFYEGFSDNEEAYFSPSNHVSLGLILQDIERFGPLAVDMEVNPQLLITDGESGWGGHWHLKLTAAWDRLFVGGGIFGFYDHNDDYLLWRLVGQAGLHF